MADCGINGSTLDASSYAPKTILLVQNSSGMQSSELASHQACQKKLDYRLLISFFSTAYIKYVQKEGEENHKW